MLAAVCVCACVRVCSVPWKQLTWAEAGTANASVFLQAKYQCLLYNACTA